MTNKINKKMKINSDFKKIVIGTSNIYKKFEKSFLVLRNLNKAINNLIFNIEKL